MYTIEQFNDDGRRTVSKWNDYLASQTFVVVLQSSTYLKLPLKSLSKGCLLRQDLNETCREESSAIDISFHKAFHPIFVVSLLSQDEDNLSFFERQLVISISITIVECLTSPDLACHWSQVMLLEVILS